MVAATTTATDATDATNSFSCAETPIQLDTTLAALEAQSIRAKVRITSLVAGTGAITLTPQGLEFYLPQTTLEFNGVRHTSYGCLISLPAMHKINIGDAVRYTDLSAAELHIRFQGDTEATRTSSYTVVYPIQLGEGLGADFFASIGQLQRSRPTFGSILREDTPLLMYKGTDLDLRQAGSTCSNAVKAMHYLVALKPLSLRFTDLVRFKEQLKQENTPYTVGPVKATRAVTAAKLPLLSYIPSILLTKPAAAKTIANGYVEQAQVKCRPLDQSRDVKGSKVYVGGPGQYSTLDKELQDAADLSKTLQNPDATADVSKIETILAIVVGVLIGVFLIALVAWWFFRKEGGYTKTALLKSSAHLKLDPIEELGTVLNAVKRMA